MAFSFLTIIPIFSSRGEHRGNLAGAMAFFPLVGLCIGLLAVSVVLVLEPFLSERFECLLLVLLPIVISGGLHVDGLADFFDGFFQGKSREDILLVMKDSRIGVWGTLAVLFMVLLKWESLTNLKFRNESFIFALCLSRWSHVYLCSLLDYARTDNGLGKQVAGLIKGRELMIASVSVLAVSLILGIMGVIVFLLSAALVYLLSCFYKRKIGGITGDVIGATGEMVEVFALIMLMVLCTQK